MRATIIWTAGFAAVLACAGANVQQAGAAATYPSKPIRFICPYSPGGASDFVARTLARELSGFLGQSVIVDNRAGADGGSGTALAAKAAPDGYTLLMGNSGPLTISPSLYRKVPYDPVRDFQPVSQATVYWYVLVVASSAPFRSLDHLTAALKSKHGALTYASSGVGGGSHLAGELFKLMTGTKAIHVPYTGSAAALRALLRDRINYLFDTVATAVPHIREGQLRAFAVTATRRSQALPEVPTFVQLGLKGYDVTQWQAVVAPAGTPRRIVDVLYRAVVRALRSPRVIERIGPRAGNELVGNTPEEFSRALKSDLAKYAQIIRAAGITVQ